MILMCSYIFKNIYECLTINEAKVYTVHKTYIKEDAPASLAALDCGNHRNIVEAKIATNNAI